MSGTDSPLVNESIEIIPTPSVPLISKDPGKQFGTHQDNSARRILQFPEQLEKVMLPKSPALSNKESDKARNKRESAELLSKMVLQRKDFKDALNKRRFQYIEVPGDNFCLFHAVAMGLSRPGEGIALLDQVIKFMSVNADV